MADVIKVLVVDDSALMRRIVSDMISEEKDIKVVATAKNGRDLLEKIDEFKPDIITLDVEMPIMNGIETLKELKRKRYGIPVIMLSSLTGEGQEVTFECLKQGAYDFVLKPSGSISLDIEKVKEELVSKIKAINEDSQTKRKTKTKTSINVFKNEHINEEKDFKRTNFMSKSENILSKNESFKNENKSSFLRNRENTNENISIKNTTFDKVRNNKKISAIVVGASTGGPTALSVFLASFKKRVSVPIFIVQHMPAGFTKTFARRLNDNSIFNVVEAEDRMEIKNDMVYIAPGGYHMIIGEDRRIHLNQEPPVLGVRPAVDKLFFSAEKCYGGSLIAVVLTGMGKDGALGMAAIKDSNGVTIAEHEDTCTIYGMPRAAVETGKVDKILRLEEISNFIINTMEGNF